MDGVAATPPSDGKEVRRISWRRTTSRSVRRNAATLAVYRRVADAVRRIVEGAGRFPLIQEPQALLGKRERQLAAARGGRKGGALTPMSM